MLRIVLYPVLDRIPLSARFFTSLFFFRKLFYGRGKPRTGVTFISYLIVYYKTMNLPLVVLAEQVTKKFRSLETWYHFESHSSQPFELTFTVKVNREIFSSCYFNCISCLFMFINQFSVFESICPGDTILSEILRGQQCAFMCLLALYRHPPHMSSTPVNPYTSAHFYTTYVSRVYSLRWAAAI